MYRCESIFPPRKEQVVILHLDSKRWSCSALMNLQNCLPGEPASELSAIQQKKHSAINMRLLRVVYSISFCITLCTSWSLFFVLSLSLNITYLNDLSDNMWGHERLDRPYFHEANLSCTTRAVRSTTTGKGVLAHPSSPRDIVIRNLSAFWKAKSPDCCPAGSLISSWESTKQIVIPFS